jgi:hypothetical protein
MRAWLAIALLMLSPVPAHAADKVCDVTVSFSSKCCGIDMQAYKAVKTILKDQPTITSRRIPWGKEGEFTLCLSTMTSSQIEPLYTQIRDALPKGDEPSRGTTIVRMKGESK